ncbi:MAG: helix-turn-helix domain-containing protein [Gemmatimonadaceae bacterium]
MSTIGRRTIQRAEQTSAMRADVAHDGPAGAPEPVDLRAPQLSPLGKRIEMLRVDRGVSKQLLARAAGTSRQQLWRVMTGKSELTSTLCQRLASVLDVDSRTLSSAALDGAHHARAALTFIPTPATASHNGLPSLAAYLDNSTLLVRTLRTLPSDEDGLALKRALLNALEERARSARLQLPAWFFRVRASVLDGTL